MATKKETPAETTEVVDAVPADVIVVDETPAAAPRARKAPAAQVAAELPETTVPVTEVAVDEVPVTEVPVAQVPPAQQPETTVLTETTPPAHEVIVVDAPVPPRKKGNRGLGVALALVATIVFTALLIAAGFALSLLADSGLDFVTDPQFYFPSLLFFVGLVVVSLVLNRAGWWSHIIGSVVVAAITWFGSASLVLLAAGMFSMNQGEANDVFFAALFSPILVISAVLAREVSIWTGAILARRGRALKLRNAEAYAAYEREQAELIPTA